jgi:AcrR family transcriptional regulator
VAKRDNRQAARALADWARDGFRRATEQQIADKYGVASRTLWRWKDALDDDPELSALFRDRLNDVLDTDWAASLDEALVETITRLRYLIASTDDLQAATEAFKALSEVALTREVLRGAVDAVEDRDTAQAGHPHSGGRTPNLPN